VSESLIALERPLGQFEIADARTREIVQRRAAQGRPATRGWFVRRMLLLADLFALLLAFALVQASSRAFDLLDVVAILAFLPFWTLLAKLYGLYDHDEERTHHTTTDELAAIFHLVSIGLGGLFIVEWALRSGSTPPFREMLFVWAVTIVSAVAARAAARVVCRGSVRYLQNTIIVGAGDIGQLVARKLLQHPEYGINVVGFVDAEPKTLRAGLEHVALLGPPDDLSRLVEVFDVERVIIAFSNETHEATVELIRSLDERDIQIDIVPRLYELVGPTIDVHSVEGLPLVGLPPARPGRSSRLLKRAIDIVGALIGLTITAPLFVYAAWRIPRESPGPVLFRQRRVGIDRSEFTVFKFRTMHTNVDESEHRDYIRATMRNDVAPNANGLYKLERKDAITPFGRFLRGTSLDEIPQLLNVLRGEMSLVGPRPCLDYETENFEPHHFARFLVRPGLTGLWQVTARANATMGEALDMDVAYARNWSLGLDLRLIVRTPLQMLKVGSTA
jgi:exopolysaccharide biosynthesis polyprenyl glycosylphosphotransferase